MPFYKEIILISPKELLNSIKNNEKILLLDVRTKHEFDLSFIKGSVNLELSAIEQNDFAIENFIDFSIYSEICIICRIGRRAQIASNLINSQFTNKKSNTRITVLDGGIINWISNLGKDYIESNL